MIYIIIRVLGRQAVKWTTVVVVVVPRVRPISPPVFTIYPRIMDTLFVRCTSKCSCSHLPLHTRWIVVAQETWRRPRARPSRCACKRDKTGSGETNLVRLLLLLLLHHTTVPCRRVEGRRGYDVYTLLSWRWVPRTNKNVIEVGDSLI